MYTEGHHSTMFNNRKKETSQMANNRMGSNKILPSNNQSLGTGHMPGSAQAMQITVVAVVVV